MRSVLLSLFLASQLGSVAEAAQQRDKPPTARPKVTAKGKVAKVTNADKAGLAEHMLQGKFGWEGDPHTMSAGRPDLPKIVFLHGAGQVTNNELIGRVVGAMRKEGVNNDVVSLPWEGNMREFDKWIKAQPGPLILSGHSAGGAYARELTEAYPEKFKAVFLINPATHIGGLKVPTLLVRGTEDYADGQEGGKNVTIVNPLHADHSLRYHPGRTTGYRLHDEKKDLKKQLKRAEKDGRSQDVTRLKLELDGMREKEALFGRYAAMQKAEVAQLPETEVMNREVASAIKKFLGENDVAH